MSVRKRRNHRRRTEVALFRQDLSSLCADGQHCLRGSFRPAVPRVRGIMNLYGNSKRRSAGSGYRPAEMALSEQRAGRLQRRGRETARRTRQCCSGQTTSACTASRSCPAPSATCTTGSPARSPTLVGALSTRRCFLSSRNMVRAGPTQARHAFTLTPISVGRRREGQAARSQVYDIHWDRVPVNEKGVLSAMVHACLLPNASSPMPAASAARLSTGP